MCIAKVGLRMDSGVQGLSDPARQTRAPCQLSLEFGVKYVKCSYSNMCELYSRHEISYDMFKHGIH